ncbi:MAG: hypothetical protein LBL04_04160 [Bacteroidales bacterium]|jgi:hypothetical protein|nr:hypothetical protein [Bacteroidales bacterium]
MDKIKMLTLLSAGFILSSSSCDRKWDESSDDRLTLEKIDYNGKELRIDGYYRRYDYAGKEKKLHGVTPYILYSNGVILGDVGVPIDRVSEMEECFRNGFYVNNAKKYYWGVFQINGIQIKYEKWVPSDGPFSTFIYEGVILNDTTFIINKYYRMKDIDKKSPTEVNWEYHFKQFSPKPDSTNRFIP